MKFTSYLILMVSFTLSLMMMGNPIHAEIIEIKTNCDLFACYSIFSIDKDLTAYEGLKYNLATAKDYALGKFETHIGTLRGVEIEILEENRIKVSGSINGASKNRWGFSILGDNSHLNSTWWNSSYDHCKNMTINQTLKHDQIIELNITGISEPSYIGIVNEGCYGGGSEIPFYNMSKTSTSIYGQYRVSEIGTNIVYSVYYANTSAVTPNRNYDWVYDHFTEFNSDRWGNMLFVAESIGGDSGHVLEFNVSSAVASCSNMAGLYFKEPITDILSYPFTIKGRWTRKTDQAKLGLVNWTGSQISLYATISPGGANFAFHYIDGTCGGGTGGSGGIFPTFFLMTINSSDATHSGYKVQADNSTEDVLATYEHAHDDAGTSTFGGGLGDAIGPNSFHIDWVCVNCNATRVIPDVTLGAKEYVPARFNVSFISPTPNNSDNVGFDANVVINMSALSSQKIDTLIIEWDGTNHSIMFSNDYGEYIPTLSGGTKYSYIAYMNLSSGLLNQTERRSLVVSTYTQNELDTRFDVEDLGLILLFLIVMVLVYALIRK